MKETVGGGPKKVLYTLDTVRKIGLKKSAKALLANNTCKACGLGMGGQKGGMANERGEFPSVCNKSVQAQSTDIQPPIPSEIFQHSIEELRELSARELEHLGRLDSPLYKAEGDKGYREVDWDWALSHAAQGFAAVDPAQSFFYSSGRSSNEAGFLLQMLARTYGTNNVNNCSYYCHQATSVGLQSTIGGGTATVELDDLAECDLIFVIGANPSSNHPRFIHQLKNCRDRGGHVVVINPAKEPGLVKFAVPKSAYSMIVGGTDIASAYLQPSIGSDIAVLKGLAKAVVEAGQHDKDFIQAHCDNASAFLSDLENIAWNEIEQCSGLTREEIKVAAELYGRSERAVFAWGMGITHHQFGSENVEYIANLSLLRGMMGKPGAGLLPLRGHSNVQGIGTIGVKPVLADDVLRNMEVTLGLRIPAERGLDTHAALRRADQGEMAAAMIVGGNLYSATPNSHWAEQALNKVGIKCYLTTTLNQGHLYGIDKGEVLIFPVAARDEEKQSTTQESMFNFVRLSDGGISRLSNTRSEVAILAEFAQRLMPDSAVDFSRFGDHETLRHTIAKVIPGMEDLKDIGIAKQEFHVRGRLLKQPRFNTANQRARFVVHPLPTANPDAERYPFLLASVRSEGQFNSIIYEEKDSYRQKAGRRSVFMCKADIDRLGLSIGDVVTLASPSGRMPVVTVEVYDLPPGNLLAYYPEANVLTGQTLDPRSQTPNFKSVPVAVIP